MSYNNQRTIIPTPANATQDLANTLRDTKVAFFTSCFTQDQILAHPKSIYSTIINSPDADGKSLEQLLGTTNAKAIMTEILFTLTTGSSHT